MHVPSITRVRVEGILPLEIWDAEVRGRSLFAWQREPGFGAALVAIVERLGASRTEPFAQLYLAGGGARRAGLIDTLRAPGHAVVLAHDPELAAVEAGRSYVLDTPPTLALDVGQSQIKILTAHHRSVLARDFARAPFRDEVAASERPRARASTLDYFAEQIVRAANDDALDRVLLALPCEIDERGVLSGCSYPWRAPDDRFLAELAEAIDAPLFVLNDAELAAIAARHDPRLGRGPTLVLTLGFGVGAAILT